jgi:uncharacterized membrane protein YgdD (TMEM256/DUF423 family)
MTLIKRNIAMTLHPEAKRSLTTASLLLLFAVVVGAFGAHGLKSMVTPEKLVTFETGVRYHFYHAFGIFLIGLLQQMAPSLTLGLVRSAFLAGILLFSGNCYLYAVTGIKVFAMIVPVGGGLFILGWAYLCYRFIKN